MRYTYNKVSSLGTFFLQASNILTSTETMHQTALLTYLQISPALLYSLEPRSFLDTPKMIQQLGGVHRVYFYP